MRTTIILLLALAATFSSFGYAGYDDAAVERGLSSITAAGAIGNVKKLADNQWEGRCAGYEGCRKAGDWIGGIFKQAGLKPIGDNQSYFQTFTFNARGRGAATPRKSKNKKKRKRRKKGQKEHKPLYDTPTSRNIVGLLEGSHPQFKDQVVVIGGHYDHVGRAGMWNAGRNGVGKANDDVWNGADDNASGSSAVIELVRAFTSSGVKPRRSILFICFSAEEHGLFGSKWYCDHPILPLDKIVTMINLDMVGYNHDKEFEVVGVDQAEGKVIRKAVQNAMKRVKGFKGVLKPWASRKDSDHASFIDKRVPATFFFSGMHKDYHTINDEVAGISGSRIANCCKVVFLTVLELANLPKQPKFVQGSGQGGSRGSLGITVAGVVSKDRAKKLRLSRKQGGIVVGAVRAGSPAFGAKVMAGDIIIGIGRDYIRRRSEQSSLQRFLRKLKPGQRFTIKVMRGKKRKSLKAKMPK